MYDSKYFADYYKKNKARKLAAAIDYYKNNRDKRKEYNAKYYSENKLKISEQSKAYRKKTASKRRSQRKSYYEKNKEAVKQKVKEWQSRNPRQRKIQRLRKYGLSLEDYDSMFSAQLGRCAICRNECKLHIDHCHVTGIVRGLLCSNCNHGIGKFKDKPETIDAAAAYLRKHTNG